MVIETPSLLITDDNPGFRETLRGVFEPQGYRTLLACDGEEAIDIVRREEVHILLLDMHMPKLTGLEVIQLVKQFKALLPCIILSADADDDLIERAQQAQAFSVLSKPVSRQTITNTVETALQCAYNWPPRRTA